MEQEKIVNNNKDLILLIEDNKFLREMLLFKLEKENLSVEVATNGEESFNKLKEFAPRLQMILLDLVLPDIDGFHILEKIKQSEETKKIPVLVLSNLGQKDDIDRCIDLGATDYLIKANFTPKEIIAKIREILVK